MQLPQMRYAIQKAKQTMVEMRGINFSDNLQDGDMSESLNISARRYPYITTRHKRAKLDYEGADAITSWDKLVVVKDGELYYDGILVEGELSEGEKQFAVVNAKLVIWPDKKYLDLTSLTLTDLGAMAVVSGGTFTTESLTVGDVDLTTMFRVGDTVTIKGSSKEGNNKDISIIGLTASTITVSADSFTAVSDTAALTIERRIPDLDYICESENRLWGCSNADRTIYASALGDPTNFFTYEGLSTDAYALAVGSEGDFTGCCKLSSSVLFWKETVLHKMLGSFPAEYSLYTYTLEGLRKGCHRSLQVINETLFYMGLHGVFAYTGGTPVLISSNFGSHEFTDAAAGNDGDTYYLSAREGDKNYLFAYETKYGLWVMEDNLKVNYFARIGKDLYMMDDSGKVWMADGGEDDPNLEWKVVFAPLYETIEGHKVYSKLQFRFQLPKGSYVIASVRADGKVWNEVGRTIGFNENISSMRVPVNRCDKFEIMLEGRGPCTILGMMREFTIGSEK